MNNSDSRYQASSSRHHSLVLSALKTEKLKNKTNSRGITVMLVLGFMGIFSILLGTITSYVFQQDKYGRAVYAREQAASVAEAGIEYYKWFLAHNPAALVDGTGIVSPYTYVVSDPVAGELGSAEITAEPEMQCGAVQWVDISSRGTSNADTGFPRTILARYMRPSVAENSYISNSNVWIEEDAQISGPYHSNGGIRMDGTNNSNVTSAVSAWTCDSSFGCSPVRSETGIFGDGNGSALWNYPTPTISFADMAADLPGLKTNAEEFGTLLGTTSVQVYGEQQGSSFPSVGESDQKGFHLVFNSDGTVSVYRVTATSGVESKHIDDPLNWQTDYHTITEETLVGTYSVPTDCSLIYSEAKIWIEGTVSGKVTVVAADDGSFSPDIILNGNIDYAATDGSTGLTAIAERSVLIPLIVPNTMSIRGVYVAQSGYFGRNLYDCTNEPYDQRSSLTKNGTIVSNLRIKTQWTYSVAGCPSDYTSGFLTHTDNYDRSLAFSPPPFTPTASSSYKIVQWGEE